MTDLQKIVVGTLLSMIAAATTLITVWLIGVRDFITASKEQEKGKQEIMSMSKQAQQKDLDNLDHKLAAYEEFKVEQESANSKIFEDIYEVKNAVAELRKDMAHKLEILQLSQNAALKEILHRIENTRSHNQEEIDHGYKHNT